MPNTKRDVITIDDLSNAEIEQIFQLADKYLSEMAPHEPHHRVRGKKQLANDFILSTLFYEPSTRTRFSFESAMLRLGGSCSGFGSAKETSAAKGETIADTVRVIENYSDIIVIRHPLEGAARVAADFASVPVINAGDGSHEHPTQTLCDLYTLRKENKSLLNLSVLICGDLKNGRTVHSLCYALARFGAHIVPWPAPGLDLPPHVRRRLEVDYNCFETPYRSNGHKALGPIDALYVTRPGPNQLALFSPPDDSDMKDALAKLATSKIDVFYITRLQKERRSPETDADHALSEYPVINKKFLSGRRYSHTTVLHPLPRIEELGYDLDGDPRGVYFKQASYGVPVRMALISGLLQLVGAENVLEKIESRSKPFDVYSRDDGIRCENENCVTHKGADSQHLTPRFWLLQVGYESVILRCTYCENEIQPVCVGRKGSRKFFPDTSGIEATEPSERVFFRSLDEARSKGYELYKHPPTHGTKRPKLASSS